MGDRMANQDPLCRYCRANGEQGSVSSRRRRGRRRHRYRAKRRVSEKTNAVVDPAGQRL